MEPKTFRLVSLREFIFASKDEGLLYGRHHQGVFRLGQTLAKLLHAFQVKIERLASVGEGGRQRRAARDDLRKIGEIDRIGRIVGLVGKCEHISPIFYGRSRS